MNTCQLKFLADLSSGNFLDSLDINEDGQFPVYGGNGLRGYTDSKTHSLEAPLIGRQGALCGNVNFAQGDFYATEHAIVAAPLNGTHPRWLYWTLTSLSLGQYSMAAAQPGLSVEVIKRVRTVAPTPIEQERIANFLDEQTARIDALIAGKERLLDLTRQFEVSQYSKLIAEGVRPHRMLVTGKEFVPFAPEGWRVCAFKRALFGMHQGWSPQCENRPAEEGEWGVLKVGCVNANSFNASENKALPETLEPDLSCVLRKGDVLVSRANTRELVGMAALVDNEYPNLLLCDKLYRLNLRPDWIVPAFAVLLLRSAVARSQIELGASGASSSMQNISRDVLRELVVAIPPIEEQKEIVARAREIRDASNFLMQHVEEHINRLREYRSSLIAAAVTGQIDINNFQLEAA